MIIFEVVDRNVKPIQAPKRIECPELLRALELRDGVFWMKDGKRYFFKDVLVVVTADEE